MSLTKLNIYNLSILNAVTAYINLGTVILLRDKRMHATDLFILTDNLHS